MSFRLFGEEKHYRTHADAQKAARKAGQPGYVSESAGKYGRIIKWHQLPEFTGTAAILHPAGTETH